MAKISQLPAADPLDGSETVPVVQAGVTKRGTIGALVAAAAAPHVNAAAASATAAANTTGQLQKLVNTVPRRPPPRFFVKGVFLQPVPNFAMQKARGFNTIVTGTPGAANDAPGAFDAGLAQYGFFGIRFPGYTNKDPDAVLMRADSLNPYIIGWHLEDEPDGIVSYVKPSRVQVTIDQLKAADSKMPLFQNLIGRNIGVTFSDVIKWLELEGVDWWCSDHYAVQDLKEFWCPLGGWNFFSTMQGTCMQGMRFGYKGADGRKIQTTSNYKPCFQYIGSSHIGTQSAPTRAQFRVQCVSSIINGADGLIMFPQVFTPTFEWDGADPNCLLEQAVLFDDIDHLDNLGMIMSPAGGRMPFTIYSCPAASSNAEATANPTFFAPLPGQFVAPFEAVEIPVGAKTYRIILNLLNVAKTLTYAPWGLNNIAFEPFGWKVFEAGAPTVDLRLSSLGYADPTFHFAAAEKGGWWTPAPARMWKDAAGTQPAVVGESVSRVDDPTGRGNHLLPTAGWGLPTLMKEGDAYFLRFAPTARLVALFDMPQPWDRVSAMRQRSWVHGKPMLGGGPIGGGGNTYPTPGLALQWYRTGALMVADNLSAEAPVYPTTGKIFIYTERHHGAASRGALDLKPYAAPATTIGAANAGGMSVGGGADMDWYGSVQVGRLMGDTETNAARFFLARRASHNMAFPTPTEDA